MEREIVPPVVAATFRELAPNYLVRDVFAGKHPLKTQVGHGGSDYAVTLQFILGFEESRGGKQHPVAVDDFPRFANEERAVSIAIEGHPETGFFHNHAPLQAFEVQGSAASVDVAAVGRNAHGNHVGSKRAKQFGSELVGCAIGAIENDAETSEFRSGDESFSEKFQIFRVQGFISGERWRILWRGLAAMPQYPGFKHFFNSVGEFHPRVREQLHAVILKWIVRCGDDHAGLKIILTNKASHARSGNHSCEGNPGSSLRETCRKQGGDVRSGFACVHAYKDMRCAMLAVKILTERASSGVKSGVVQRRRARDATYPVSSKKFLRHE